MSVASASTADLNDCMCCVHARLQRHNARRRKRQGEDDVGMMLPGDQLSPMPATAPPATAGIAAKKARPSSSSGGMPDVGGSSMGHSLKGFAGSGVPAAGMGLTGFGGLTYYGVNEDIGGGEENVADVPGRRNGSVGPAAARPPAYPVGKCLGWL